MKRRNFFKSIGVAGLLPIIPKEKLKSFPQKTLIVNKLKNDELNILDFLGLPRCMILGRVS
jgi:hypothetical protein